MNINTDLTLLSQTQSFAGELCRYQHQSKVLACDMEFALYLPPQAKTEAVPLLWWLSGLTCTDENFMQKAGAQRIAAELGIAIVCPDTSPRGLKLEGEDDSYDFGSGAGFYLNATREPWSRHYRMYDYIVQELPGLVRGLVNWNNHQAVSGHSMGGHGALVLALKNPGLFNSVSAFAPIANPMQCPWGQKAFSGYLGSDKTEWTKYDACELIRGYTGDIKPTLLVDQGTADTFLAEQLKPEHLQSVCDAHNYPLQLRYQQGYDHSYYFIATFIEDHLRHHARFLW